MTLQVQLESLRSAAINLPDAEGVSRAIALIGCGLPYDQLFFAELKDPAWLPILESKGFFEMRPESAAEGAPRSLSQQRLALFALTRFADRVPEVVAAILLRIPLPNSKVNADQVLRCLASLRDRQGITSVRPLAAYLAEATHRVASVWIGDMLKSWIESGALTEAIGVLRRFLSGIIDSSIEDQQRYDNHYQLSEIDRQFGEQLATVRPLDIIVIYFEGLSRWGALRRSIEVNRFASPWGPTDDPARDLPAIYWLEDFKQPTRGSRELEGTMATRLFLSCQKVFETEDAAQIAYVESLLRSDRWILFTRLRWQLYADFPKLTLKFARGDVRAVIPFFGHAARYHDYEFAQLLTSHVKTHGEKFLTAEEITQITTAVFSGPINQNGELVNELNREVFWRKQLRPLAPLLGDDSRKRLQLEASVPIEAYKPIQSGEVRSIQQTSPLSPEQLAEKSNAEIWDYLNSWSPSNRLERSEWWIEETVSALAMAFAIVVERSPKRFSPDDAWWENLTKPAILHRILDRASDRIAGKVADSQAISQSDWSNWFGLAGTIINRARLAPEEKNDPDQEGESQWSTLSAARFLKAAVKAEYGGSPDLRARTIALLRMVVAIDDPRLDNSVAIMGDWLTTAINSARGDAMEAILDIALEQFEPKKSVEPWIFEVIETRLGTLDESPAIFALLGSRLRLMVHLFADKLRGRPQLLFPEDRPEHKDAAILSHFQYDSPMLGVLQMFPNLISSGLSLLERSVANPKELKDSRREFGSRLGMHIAFYHWNAAFSTESLGEEALDKIFSLGSADVRAAVIEQIGSAFERATEDQVPSAMRERVMNIWERRFDQIVGMRSRSNLTPNDYQGELAAFTDWIRCECFPIKWRVDRVISALNMLTTDPRPYRLVKYIGEQSGKPERLLDMLMVLESLIRHPNDQARWWIQEKEIRPLLDQAINNQNPEVRQQAEGTLDLLLRRGYLSFMSVGRS